MGAGCSIQVHAVTGGDEVGRAVTAAARGRRPIRTQSGIERGAGRDDQHIGPSAEVGDAVSASADDETVAPRAAYQRIIADTAIQAIIARAAAEAIGTIAAEQRIGIGRAGEADACGIASIAHQPTMSAGCCGQVHCITCARQIGRAVIAAAGGGGPGCDHSDIGCGAGRDDQHIRPGAQVGDAVSAGTAGETIGPCPSGQGIIARPAIQAIIAIAAVEAINATTTAEDIVAGPADQGISIGRAGQADGSAIISIAHRPTIGA